MKIADAKSAKMMVGPLVSHTQPTRRHHNRSSTHQSANSLASHWSVSQLVATTIVRPLIS